MSIFDKYYSKYDFWYEKNRFAYLSELKALKSKLARRGKGLEVGVGTGRFAQALGIKSGIDPSPNMLKIARVRGINARLGYAEALPFDGRSFNHILMVITLCFVKDPYKAIHEAMRCLKPAGQIIIGIVDRDSFLGRYYRRKRSVFYKRARFFRVKDLISLLKEAGFKKISCCQTISVLPKLMKKVEEPKPSFGRGGFVVISGIK